MKQTGLNIRGIATDEGRARESGRNLPEGWFGMIKIGPYHGIKKGEKELVRRNYESGAGFNRLEKYWECARIGGTWNGNKLKSKR